MKMRKRIYIATSIVLLASTTAFLMSTVVDLKDQRKVRLETISQLKQKITHLENKLDVYKKENEKLTFYKFKENVFNLKYPNFSQIVGLVFKKSLEYGFNPYLVMAVIQVESDFDQYAVSPAGAYGLMQINYSVWKDVYNIDLNKIFEKAYNIDLGLKILKHYYKKASGNIFQALFRYNNGYKYQNFGYNWKIIATKFYPHSQHTQHTQVSAIRKTTEEDVSI